MNGSKVMATLTYLGVTAKKKERISHYEIRSRPYQESFDTICLTFYDQMYYSYHPKLETVGPCNEFYVSNIV
jgi:hypothetical protein